MPPRQISDDSHHHVEPKTKPTAKTIILDPVIPAAICSFLLFIFILILQIRGLVAAVSGNKPESAPPTAWCSPAFQPFGVIVLDGNCRTYEISQSRQRGIGCIVLPGIWQQQWLRMSVAFTALSLLLQGLDLLWMAMVNRSWKPKGVKVKRPWLTMIFGVVVLGVTLFYGIDYAQSLPSGITDLVTVVEDVDGYKGYSATLKAAGLRGAVIGWSDGLFSSWKQLYYGA